MGSYTITSVTKDGDHFWTVSVERRSFFGAVERATFRTWRGEVWTCIESGARAGLILEKKLKRLFNSIQPNENKSVVWRRECDPQKNPARNPAEPWITSPG